LISTRVGEIALAWRRRTELLEGDHGLERLSGVELRRLVQKQKVHAFSFVLAQFYQFDRWVWRGRQKHSIYLKQMKSIGDEQRRYSVLNIWYILLTTNSKNFRFLHRFLERPARGPVEHLDANDTGQERHSPE
jgi:hypothetical protein